ncbi:MAG: GNAT family N-acetyltransferase [Firmicutes bacterium HGW-Firmicutes-9]|jgi:GNAT superfamily N-acetyltransferase|nr:MAG: GNAT family N-acetyltransferase [Firmicutes bacterium HGW-Firmicutes-9]
MSLEIQPLSPALADVFCDYLTHLDFSATPHWSSCFCRFYHTTCSQQDWIDRTAEENRAEAKQEILAGNMRGYLAFDAGVCVGWCNANDVAQYPRLSEYTEELCRGKRVGCTICFVIHPDYRGKGVAREMLARAISDFRAAGYDAMLAAPVDAPGAEQSRYRGTLHMYQEAGYKELQTIDQVHVMWLDLV